jgi:ferritin-like metal-binding protein YciE
MNDLEKLFLSELESLYQGEKGLAEALPDFERHARSPDLKSVFREHTEQTRGHIDRLEQIFREIGETPKEKTCHSLEGIISEGQAVAKEFEGGSAFDIGIIAAAQKSEHYEMASYSSLYSWAEKLGHDRIAGWLQNNFNQEKETSARLTRLARSSSQWGHAQFEKDKLLKDFRRVFFRQVREMYDAEHLLISALAELEYYAESRLLRFAFAHHRKQTEKHVENVEKVFKQIGETADRRPCEGIEGIIDDAQVYVEEFLGNSALDSAIIAAARKAELYEISGYLSLYSSAKELGENGALPLFEENLKDERSTDRKLNLAANWFRNPKAKHRESTKRFVETAEFLKLATHGS